MIHLLAAYGDPPDPGGDALKVLIALLPAISTIVGLCIMYAVIKAAVLSALRQHEREKSGVKPMIAAPPAAAPPAGYKGGQSMGMPDTWGR